MPLYARARRQRLDPPALARLSLVACPPIGSGCPKGHDRDGRPAWRPSRRSWATRCTAGRPGPGGRPGGVPAPGGMSGRGPVLGEPTSRADRGLVGFSEAGAGGRRHGRPCVAEAPGVGSVSLKPREAHTWPALRQRYPAAAGSRAGFQVANPDYIACLAVNAQLWHRFWCLGGTHLGNPG